MTHLPMLFAMAANPPESADPLGWLINYGIAGIVLGLLVTGRIRTKAEVDGLREELVKAQTRASEKDTAMAALVQQVTQHTLPQMTHLADVLDKVSTGGPESSVQATLTAILARLDQRPSPSGGD